MTALQDIHTWQNIKILRLELQYGNLHFLKTPHMNLHLFGSLF